MSIKTVLFAGAMLAVSVSATSAATISYGVVPPGPAISVPLTTTNFTRSFLVPKFDTALGTLQSVQFVLNGMVVSTIRFESLDAAPSTVTGTAAATVTLTRPDNTTLVAVVPTQTRTATQTAYDGVTDFGGTSGDTFAGLTGSTLADSGLLTSAADLALFSGTAGSTIALPVTAAGSSTATGPGNIVAQINTQAAADVTVTYVYDVPTTTVPEPASLVLLGASLAGAGLLRRRKAA